MIKNRGAKLIATVAASLLAASGLVTITSTAANADANSITFWAPSEANPAAKHPYEEVAKAFMKKYPKYTINFKAAGASGAYQSALSTALQAGNGPDVFKIAPGTGQPDSAVTLAKAGLLLDITANASKVVPAKVKWDFAVGNKIYALPISQTVGNLVVNRGLMKKDGLTWPKTFEELLTQCATAKTKGRTSFFVLAGSAQPNLQLLIGDLSQNTYKDQTWTGKRLANKVDFQTTVGWRKSLDQIDAMVKAGCFQPGAITGGFGDINTLTRSEKVYASFVPGATSVSWTTDGSWNGVPDLVTSYIPAAKGDKTYIPASFSYGIAANAKTQNLTLTKLFINYMASAEGRKVFCDVSGAWDIFAKTDTRPQYAPLIPYVKSGATFSLPFQSFPSATVTAAMSKGIQGIIAGQPQAVGKTLKQMDLAWNAATR